LTKEEGDAWIEQLRRSTLRPKKLMAALRSKDTFMAQLLVATAPVWEHMQALLLDTSELTSELAKVSLLGFIELHASLVFQAWQQD
jgi:hypothetical protein